MSSKKGGSGGGSGGSGGNKDRPASMRGQSIDPLAEGRGVGERFEDPITGRAIEAEDRIWLRDRPWSRASLLDWVARDNDGLSPVWPDTGREISKRDLEDLYASYAVAMHAPGGVRSASDQPVQIYDASNDYYGERGRVMPSGPRGFGGGGFGGGGFHGGGFRGGGLGLGAGLLGGALVGSALTAGAYGAYGPYGYGGYGGGYYGAPIVDPYYPYGRRRVVIATEKPNADEEERRQYMLQRLRARHAKRLREERDREARELVDSEGRGHRQARKENGEYKVGDARGNRSRSTGARGRDAKGRFSGTRTRQAALRDEVMSSFDQDTYHQLYWSMKADDRAAVQQLLRKYMEKAATLKGRIDDQVESNRLIENGLLPFVDHFTGERGIMPNDAMVYRGRLVSRRGFMLWLEEHKHDEMPPTMFDNAELERDDLTHELNVHPEEYEFFRRRRAQRRHQRDEDGKEEEEDDDDAIEDGVEGKRDDDEMRRRARQYKEDYDAGRVKPTRDEFRMLPFREYLNAEDWSHVM